MPNPHDLTGPEFLQALAHAETCNGLTINAAEYNRRGDEWQGTIDNLEMVKDLSDDKSVVINKATLNAAKAYDLLSAVRPAGECTADYIQVRRLLALISGLEYGPAAWESSVPTDRDPRTLPMPGDRYYLPVEVIDVLFKATGSAITYAPMASNGEHDLVPVLAWRFHALGGLRWNAEAIAIVAAPPAAPVLEMAA